MRTVPLVAVALLLAPAVLAGLATGAVAPLAASSQLALGVAPVPATLAGGLLGATLVTAGGAAASTFLTASLQGNVLVLRSNATQAQTALLRLAAVDGEQHLRRGEVSLGGVAQLAAREGRATSTPTPVLLPPGAALPVDSTLAVHSLGQVTLDLRVELRHPDGGPTATERWTLTIGARERAT